MPSRGRVVAYLLPLLPGSWLILLLAMAIPGPQSTTAAEVWHPRSSSSAHLIRI